MNIIPLGLMNYFDSGIIISGSDTFKNWYIIKLTLGDYLLIHKSPQKYIHIHTVNDYFSKQELDDIKVRLLDKSNELVLRFSKGKITSNITEEIINSKGEQIK